MCLQSIRARINFFICILILTAGTSISAADIPERGWTIGPSIGVVWGTAYEIVYDTSGTPNENDYLSLLIWDLDPTVTLGFESLWDSGTGNALEMKLTSAVPGMPVGEMNDFDWLYTDMDWSHWSVSDVNLRWGILFDVEFDHRFVDEGPFTLNLGAGYHLDWWAWRDTTKDSLYSTITGPSSGYPATFGTYSGDGFRDRPDVVATGVDGIDYEVAYHVPLISLNLGLDYPVFFFRAAGRIGPVIALSHDHHKLRTEDGNVDGLHFYDSAFGGPWIDANLAVGFRTKGRFIFTIRGEYAWLNETRGDTLVVPTNGTESGTAKDSGGFSFRRIGVSVLASWNLGGS